MENRNIEIYQQKSKGLFQKLSQFLKKGNQMIVTIINPFPICAHAQKIMKNQIILRFKKSLIYLK